LLKAAPDLDVATLHQRIIDRDFDTGKNLKEFPTEKIEGKRMAVIGFGNIGREMTQIARAFNLEVVVHDLPWCKEWAESEGFTYAATVKEAAQEADFITIHTGLGIPDPNTGKFANENIIDAEVLNSLNDGAVVVNYDRGELINAQALDNALASGKVRYAAIDADMFKNPETGEISGPAAPYLGLEKKHRGRMELLPHAAADTEHLSRVEGAKQAVDQIMGVIQYKAVVNLKGDLPKGYTDAGAKTVDGVGSVSALRLAEAVAEDDFLANARKTAERLAAIWGSLSATTNPERRAELLERYGSELIMGSNRYATLVERSGLKGPYRK
jgi:phosphoglycerate dehydrogenase-like enzyme